MNRRFSRTKTTSSAPKEPPHPLKHTILKIHHNRLIHQPPQPHHKRRVRLILLDIVIPILHTPKLHDEPMRDISLETLLGVVLPPLQREDVRLSRKGVHAVCLESKEPGADLVSLRQLIYPGDEQGRASLTALTASGSASGLKQKRTVCVTGAMVWAGKGTLGSWADGWNTLGAA